MQINVYSPCTGLIENAEDTRKSAENLLPPWMQITRASSAIAVMSHLNGPIGGHEADDADDEQIITSMFTGQIMSVRAIRSATERAPL